MRLVSLYIHIPFCVQICRYCDFAVSRLRSSEEMKTYTRALTREITARLAPLAPLRASSIYFGGGTPSLLDSRQLEAILKTLSRFVRWDTRSEVTLETNPDTFDLKAARAWKRLGINRTSLGTQSFHDSTLEKLGRLHRQGETLRSFETLRLAGHDNINLDLIYALPSESLKDFAASLREAIHLSPEHISLYQLAIEPRTPFHRLHAQGHLRLPSENTARQMYRLATSKLERAGFRHYELQNFSRPGFESTHNRRYWNHEEFLGFGVGAYSYWDHERFGNTRVLSRYLKGASRGIFRPETREKITSELEARESLILGLRMADGVDPELLERTRGLIIPPALKEKLEELTKAGLLKKRGSTFRLTRRGEELSETVASELV